jgi:hypothetical protein
MKNKKTIDVLTRELSDMCLNEHGQKIGYTEEDLFNASLIFMHFLSDKQFDFTRKLGFKKMLDMGTKSGRELHKFILKYTGIDMKKVALK